MNLFVFQFDYELIANKLFKVASAKECILRNRKSIYDLVKKFKALAKGVFPMDEFTNLPELHDEEERKFKQRMFMKSKKKKKPSTKRLNKSSTK